MAIHPRTRSIGTRVRSAVVAAALLSAIVAIVPPAAQAAPGDLIVYGVNGLGSRAVTELNLTAGTATSIGTVGSESESVDIDPSTGRLYWYEWNAGANEFGYFEPDTGSNTVVRTYSPTVGVRMTRMAFAPSGQLYLMDVSDNLYTIDHANGDVALVGAVSGLDSAIYTGIGDMAFAPDGTLYVVSGLSLFAVDTGLLTATELHSDMLGQVTAPGIKLWTGLAFCDGTMYASHAEAATGQSAVWQVDPVTGDQQLEFYAGPAFRDLTSCAPTDPVNTAPVAANDSVTTDEDVAVAVTLSATDADGDPLTYTIETGPANGSLTGTAPNLTYTPDTGYFGSDSFTYTANDGTTDSNTATINITVDQVNTAPVAANDSVTTDEDVAVAVTLSATDADGDPLTYTVETGPTNGSLSGTAPNLTYTPDTGFVGSDSFTYTANDGLEDSNEATVSISVALVNVPPVAPNDSVTTDEDVAVAVTLAATDADGDPLTYTVETGPANGSLTGTAPNLTYTPDTGFVGSDSFTYTANDGLEDSNEATVSISVALVNVPPVAANDSVTTDEDVAVAVTLAATDADGDPLTYTVETGPANGSLTGTAPNLTYTPNPGYFGPDSFTYTANDGLEDSNEATVSISVALVNVPPVAANDSVTTDEDVAVAVTLAATDADGDPLTYTIETGPTNGSLTGTAPNLTYTPNPGYFGPDSFTYTANDGTTDSNTATISITVDQVNTAPVATDDSVTTDEDVAVAVTLSATDADGDTLTYTVETGPTNGSLSGTAPNLTYTPDPGYFGPDSFTFTANDGTTDSNTATISITVDEATTAPTVPGVPVGVSGVGGDGVVVLSWSAPADDGGAAVTDYVIEYAPQGGSYTVFADGVSTATTATVTGLTNYDQYDFRVAALNSVGTGATNTDTATPTDGNDPDDTFNYPNGALSDTTAWTRLDPANLADLTIVDGHLEGTNDPDGTAATWNTPVGPNVEVTIDVGLGDNYNEASVVLRMNNTTEYTSAYLLQWVTDGDHTTAGTIDGPTAQIWRIDPGPSFTLLAETSLPDTGERTLTFGANGSSLYIAENTTTHLTTTDSTYPTGDYFALGQADLSSPAGNPSHIDNLRYTTLTAPNTAPIAANDTITTDEDVAVAVTLSATDADGDPLTYAVETGPTNGTLSGTAPNLTYTPDPGFVGADSFTYTANDGTTDSNEATISITVNEDTPTFTTWGADRDGNVRSIDLTNGTSTSESGLSFGTHAMDRDPTTGVIYYLEWTTGTQFGSYDPATGANTLIRTYSPALGLYMTQMAFAPDGTLYAIDDAANLYTIDPANGDVTGLGPVTGLSVGANGQIGDLAFAADGTAYIASTNSLYELDLTTRVATTLHTAMFGRAPHAWLGLTWCDGQLYGSHINGFNFRSTIYRIDLATGAITEIVALPTYIADLTGCAAS